MSDTTSDIPKKNPHRSRGIYAACAVVVLLLYIASAGPVTWLVYHKGGFEPGNRYVSAMNFCYTPLQWVVDRLPERAQHVWTRYIDYFYEIAYKASMEDLRALIESGLPRPKGVVNARSRSPLDYLPSDLEPSVPRYGSRTLAEWQARLKQIDPQSGAHDEDVPGLIELTKSADVPWFTRKQAALALGRIRSSAGRAVPVFLELLAMPAPANKEGKTDETPASVWAAQALAAYGPEARAAAPALIERVQDPHRSFAERLVAIEALAAIGIGEPTVLPVMIGILEHLEPQADGQNPALLREAAAEAVVVIGSGAAPAIPSLIRALSDPAEGVRLKSVIALGSFGMRSEIALPALFEALTFDESPSVRDAAVAAVGRVGEPAVPELLRLLDEPDPALRARVLTALGNVGPSAAQASPRVVALLDDEEPSTRIGAAEALWRINPSDARIPAALVRAMADNDRQIRMRASRTLSKMGPVAKPAIGPLRKLAADDERDDVRRLASRTLREIESTPLPAAK